MDTPTWIVICVLAAMSAFCAGVRFGETGVVYQLISRYPHKFRWSDKENTMYYKDDE